MAPKSPVAATRPKQRPLEFFGRFTDKPAPSDGHWKKLKEETPSSPYKDFPCAFRGGACNKIRKAAPNPLIGNCSLSFASGGSEEQKWIVCPSRFLQDDIIFKDCRRLLKEPKSTVEVVKELKIGDYGTLDHALVQYDNAGKAVEDFVGIEIQGIGTSSSGPIWDARNDYLQDRLRHHYSYGTNLKDASKKILVQLLHKCSQISRWRFTTVLVVQDMFLDHLKEAYNINLHFHPSQAQDFLHIHAYRLIMNTAGDGYTLKLVEQLSTDVLGLSMALISNPTTEYVAFTTLQEKLVERKETGASRILCS